MVLCGNVNIGSHYRTPLYKAFGWVLTNWLPKCRKNGASLLDKMLQMARSISAQRETQACVSVPKLQEKRYRFRRMDSVSWTSTLKPFKRLAKTLSRNAQQVLNFFRFRLTSGRIEGMNSMISRVQLKTRGLPSVDYLRLKLRQLTSPPFTLLFWRSAQFFYNGWKYFYFVGFYKTV